jgi:phage-related protein
MALDQPVEEKELRWVGTSHDDLIAFPATVKREAGFQLAKVQTGHEPTDWQQAGY